MKSAFLPSFIEPHLSSIPSCFAPFIVRQLRASFIVNSSFVLYGALSLYGDFPVRHTSIIFNILPSNSSAAGASVDDVFVIVLFYTFLSVMQGEGVSVVRFINIPVSIVLGIVIGIVVGIVLGFIFENIKLRDTIKVFLVLGISILLVVVENSLKTPITFSALISVMCIGIGINKKNEKIAKAISNKYGKIWVIAEVFLFVLVGATVNIYYLKNVGLKAVILIAGVLIFRMLGVFVCMLGTKIKAKERLFAMIAYTPKATVQAAIGGIPLSLGLACGDTILTVAVLAIVLTAPLGAFTIDLFYKKLLSKS